MKYKDKRIDDITINQLIAQTSGIPGILQIMTPLPVK